MKKRDLRNRRRDGSRRTRRVRHEGVDGTARPLIRKKSTLKKTLTSSGNYLLENAKVRESPGYVESDQVHRVLPVRFNLFHVCRGNHCLKLDITVNNKTLPVGSS